MLENLKEYVTDQHVVSTFAGVLILIFLGYFLRKKNIFTSNTKDALTTILLKLAIPSIAFDSFMTEFNKGMISVQIASFFISAAAYALTVLITRLVFRKLGKEKAQVLSIISALGQLTLFALPVLKALFDGNAAEALITVNTVTINFRIMTYVYSYLIISGLKFDKQSIKSSVKTICLNPIVIAMFAGLVIYLLQDVVPSVTIGGKTHSAIRIDLYCPPLYSPIKTLASIVSPLAMLLTGVICGGYDLKKALKQKLYYLVAFIRTVLVPLMVLGFACATQFIFNVGFTEYSLTALVIGFGAPISAVICAYSVKYQREEEFVSGTLVISVLFSLISVPMLGFLCRAVCGAF